MISFKKHSGIYTLEAHQELKITLGQAWKFFSSPKNLIKITPPEMALIPKSAIPEKMYRGSFIKYTVKPILGIPLTWVTEISEIQEGYYFIDEQRLGPFKIWHHEHHFKVIDGGVEMRDELWYALPFGFLGNLVNSLFVKRKIQRIFEYRRVKLIELFGNFS